MGPDVLVKAAEILELELATEGTAEINWPDLPCEERSCTAWLGRARGGIRLPSDLSMFTHRIIAREYLITPWALICDYRLTPSVADFMHASLVDF